MNTVVHLRPGKTPPPPHQVCILIGSASGGATATTTALGVAAVLSDPGYPVVLADATTDGGNLFERGAAHPLREHVPIVAGLPVSSASTTAGATVCGAAAYRSDLALIDSIVADRSAARIFDAGTAVDTPRVAVVRGRAVLVLTTTARAEPLTRLRASLSRLRTVHGPAALARTIVVVSHTVPADIVDLSAVRSGLTPVIGAVVEVPFDSALAAPGLFDHRTAAPSSAGAWSAIAAAALTLSMSAPSPSAHRKREQA